MITEEVNTFLLAARSGRAPLVMSGHILILNWNEQVRVRPLSTAAASTGYAEHFTYRRRIGSGSLACLMSYVFVPVPMRVRAGSVPAGSV